jgi:hypothetical protein
MILPGLVSVTFRSLDVPSIVALSAQCGLKGIEWGADVHIPVGDLIAAEEARTQTANAGIAVTAYGSYYRAGASQEDMHFEDVLLTAIALGAPKIRVWAGSVCSEKSTVETRKSVVEDLRQICGMAAAGQVKVVLEYHRQSLTDTLESTLLLLQEVGSPTLQTGWQPSPERSNAEHLAEVQALQPWLSDLHVFQWESVGGTEIRKPLKTGETSWQAIFQSIHGERFALLEFVPNDDPAALPTEAATLRSILKGLPL